MLDSSGADLQEKSGSHEISYSYPKDEWANSQNMGWWKIYYYYDGAAPQNFLFFLWPTTDSKGGFLYLFCIACAYCVVAGR